MTASPEEVAEHLALAEIEPFPPRYNIAPTQPILVVVGGHTHRGANSCDRAAVLARWGLIPSWVKDVKGFPLLFNARSETAATKNAFRAAMKYRRCLIPASGFYEWKRDAAGKTKAEAYLLRRDGGSLFAFAGLMETYLSPDGSEIDTAAILTKPSSGVVADIHDRMPVVVRRRDHARWLDCRGVDTGAVSDILAMDGEDRFSAVRISDKVNRVANTGRDVQLPLTATGPSGDGDGDGTSADAAGEPRRALSNSDSPDDDQPDLF